MFRIGTIMVLCTLLPALAYAQEPQQLNWANAVDPVMDITQRYTLQLHSDFGPEHYPAKARQAKVGEVRALFTVYIDKMGRIRDVRIRSLRSDDDAHKPFEAEFRRAVREILLTRTRVEAAPYTIDGVWQDIVWDSVLTFRLQ